MKRITIIAAAVLLLAFPVRADIAQTTNQAELILHSLPSETFRKSGTPEIVALFSGQSGENAEFMAVYRTLSRPGMDRYLDSAHFRVHYDTTGVQAPDLADYDFNGIPDYVDSTVVYLEYAWELIIGELGYDRPVSDGNSGGGDGLTDCYLMELSGQAWYGYTSPEGGTLPTPSYLVVDNDFSESVYPTKSFDALKITTAHEFFHVIHYHYYGPLESLWWMEQTAVWMEERAWPDVNDYINYIWLLFQNRNTPIDSNSGNFMYGATLFAMQVAYNYGESYIRQAWDRLRSSRSGTIENFNSVFPQGVAGALSDLAVWMYFTDYRAADEAFFPDAPLMRYAMPTDLTVVGATATDSLSFKQYTFKYVSLEPKTGFAKGDSLYFAFTDRDNGTWRNQVILYESANDYAILPLSGLNAAIEFPGDFSRAVLVLANGSQLNTTYHMVFSIELKECVGVEEEPLPAPFALHHNYPNPFNAATTIPFSIDAAGHASLRVLNLQGQTVAVLEDRWYEPGDYRTSFTPSGIASGIYLIILESGALRRSQRMVYMK